MKHLNFYETLKEAHIRLLRTVVLYDNVPYYVLAITDHMKDGIFRIYLSPLNRSEFKINDIPWPNGIEEFHPEQAGLGPWIDKWMEATPNHGILRKQMNSPLFNRYRPFPLGMCNYGKRVLYLERAPMRPKTEQGLTRQMITETTISLSPSMRESGARSNIDTMSVELKNCILADHPDPGLCLDNLNSDEYINEAVAFHRDFAFVKGPLGMIFLAYKTDVIGLLTRNNFQYLRLGKNFLHYREVCLDLGLFHNVD